MMPFSRINTGDVYRNWISGSEWVVVEKDEGEKMVKVMMMYTKLPPALNKGIWKKATDRMFCESNRVLVGR